MRLSERIQHPACGPGDMPAQIAAVTAQARRPRARPQHARPRNAGSAAAAALTAPLRQRLSQFVALTHGEAALLDELQQRCVSVPRNRNLVVRGCHYERVFVLNRGVAIRYKVMRDGRRQIVNFILPGEWIGFPGAPSDAALYSVATLTDAVVAPIAFGKLRQSFDRSPRLAAAMFWQAAHEAAMYAEHVIDIGRRSAYQAVAHFLLELRHRLRIVRMDCGDGFELPLTQELIGDALGLSVVHVNRTFRCLRERGLVTVEGHRYLLKDIQALAKVAEFDASYLTPCGLWLTR